MLARDLPLQPFVVSGSSTLIHLMDFLEGLHWFVITRRPTNSEIIKKFKQTKATTFEILVVVYTVEYEQHGKDEYVNWMRAH